MNLNLSDQHSLKNENEISMKNIGNIFASNGLDPNTNQIVDESFNKVYKLI
jgi:hypothetical protein